MRLSENKIILVTRKTRLEELIVKYNTIDQARFYIEHLGADFNTYLAEHRNYRNCVSLAETTLLRLARLQIVERSFLPNLLFAEKDIVIVLGQDGLVANTMKYLNGQQLIGVNPDAKHWDGVLLPFQVRDLARLLPEVFAQRRKLKEITMAKASLNNGQVIYGVNDIFIGPKSHTSALYTLKLQEKQERQSSSGIIISTGLGSTGWMTSILTGAATLHAQLHDTGQNLPYESTEITVPPLHWDARELMFAVREPFPSKASFTSLVHGHITQKNCLQVSSQMAEHGVIFSDGIETDYLEFNAGLTAEISVAEKRGYLVM